MPPAVVLVAALLGGCTAGDPGSGTGDAPMGWIERQDEETGIGFALPPPISGPEETRRPGRATAVASTSYGSRSGELALSVQLLSTPEDPDALEQELPPRRVPLQVLDQISADGDYETEVLSNARVEGPRPTFDSELEVNAGEQTAVWWMRTQALDDVVVVTQVVAFVDGKGVTETRSELEAQGAAAFRRLNQTVVTP